MIKELSPTDLSILKYYNEGKELCGFEGVHMNLCDKGYLDGDLELTNKAYEFIKEFNDWDSIETFNNKTYVRVKPKF